MAEGRGKPEFQGWRGQTRDGHPKEPLEELHT